MKRWQEEQLNGSDSEQVESGKSSSNSSSAGVKLVAVCHIETMWPVNTADGSSSRSWQMP
jgi:hypothetical protein